MPKTIIVSNRLPLRIEPKENGKGYVYIPSEGGLATGLGSVYKGGGNIWVGWPGADIDSDQEKEDVRNQLSRENMWPVFLSKEEIEDFYEGFCNSTLWPNFHYFTQYAQYKRSHWEAYEAVNAKFCEEIAKVAQEGDTIWVHDYQLMLLPSMIRQQLGKVGIGFFLHIPFPSHEVFRLIPWRRELLNGVLGSDLIGFHTYDDMRHFLSAVNRLVYLPNQHGRINMGTRIVEVDSFPMGIDYDKFARQAASPDTINFEVKYRTSLGRQKLILSIDRLDYSKGIPQRLIEFDLFFKKYPEWLEKVSLILLVVPSRDKVVEYKELKEEVDLLVGRINGNFGTMNWTPIHYFYRSLPFTELCALYRMADVCLVTPMRDGMNLVCKEFVASRLDQSGVLILSEMAGASKELNEALLINPNDKHQVADSIKAALEMPVAEQKRNMQGMQKTLQRYNIHHWVTLFLNRLKTVMERQEELSTRILDQKGLEMITEKFKKAQKKLLFLDYDGTLVDFNKNPEAAEPDDELLSILAQLTTIKDTRVVIITGRSRESIEPWMANLDIDMIAEHGVWHKAAGDEWETIEDLDFTWKDEIRPILDMYVSKTPGSLIEEKDYSLVWHYRKVELGLGEMRAREIVSHLKFMASAMRLQVLEGSKVVEIKNIEVNKGRSAAKWMNRYKSDFILAIGDDWTDEDTFAVLPKSAFSIKVGATSSTARFSIDDVAGVRRLLTMMG